jgi:hypothetical protein
MNVGFRPTPPAGIYLRERPETALVGRSQALQRRSAIPLSRPPVQVSTARFSPRSSRRPTNPVTAAHHLVGARCGAARRGSPVIRSRLQRHAVHDQPARRQRLRRGRCRRRISGRHLHHPRRACTTARCYGARRPGDPGARLAGDQSRFPGVSLMGPQSSIPFPARPIELLC